MKVLTIIPARGGSKGLPRKNVRLLAGKPLLAYTIEAAREATLVNLVIVSTDDEDIAAVARQYGADVPFLRPPELAQDDTPTEPVLQHALAWVEAHEPITVDIVVFLQPTDIFRPPGIVDDVVRRVMENDAIDSCFAAYPTHKNFWRRQDGQWIRLAPDIAYGARQRREHLYREDTGIACATRAEFIRQGRRIGPQVDIAVYESEVSWIDIHDEFTFWLAEKVLTEWSRPRR